MVQSTCAITVLLPSTPVDLYVGETLIKARAFNKLEMVTPNLTAGEFSYTMVIKDSSDSTKVRKKVVNNIVAGGKITVDLRSWEVAAL